MSYLLDGKPVRVQFMRWDDHGWDNHGPAQLMDIRATVNAAGKITAWDFHHWSTSGNTATEPTQELAQGFLPAPVNSQSAGRIGSAGQVYATPNYRYVDHTYNGVMNKSLRGGTLRSPMDPSQLFGSEQMVDALAHTARQDPMAFRRREHGRRRRWVSASRPPPPQPAGSRESPPRTSPEPNVVTGAGSLLARTTAHRRRGGRHRGRQEDREVSRPSTCSPQWTRARRSTRA